MKKRLIGLTILFSAIIIIATVALYFLQKQVNYQDIKGEQIVALNEIEQLAKLGEIDEMTEKVLLLQKNIQVVETNQIKVNGSIMVCAICICFLILVFGYVYVAILHPFEKMKKFAQKISEGNFDEALEYERSNYFGDFTWAFDSMRKEITSARSCEKEAIENNKTVIATLSHDIKTPIASIRAYAEGLEASLDGTPEKRAKYLDVIMKKCDEVSRLTNDLFLHSISDLDKLKVTAEKMEVCGFFEKVVSEISAEQKDIHFEKPEFVAWVQADANRLTQIAENLINNARKYAKSQVNIWLKIDEDAVLIHFRDFGEGIPDEDMPFIYDKFYRGKNSGNEQGSGLGLYIVKYIMTQMQGEVLLHNHSDGLEAIISLPIISKVS